MNYSVTHAVRSVSSYKQWGLDPSISPDQIDAKLAGIGDQGLSADAKVQHRWVFLFNGQECAIWDFKGVRWSAYGPREAFDALGFPIVWED